MVGFRIGTYEDQVLCDVLNMDACHVLLGRPWQHDRKTRHDGFTNVYTLKHEGKLKDLLPHKVIPPPNTKTPLHLMSRRSCEKELRAGNELFILFTIEISNSPSSTNLTVLRLLKKFEDVFPTDLPKGLPPIKWIEHQIDLIPGAPLPNKPSYRSNPKETQELQRQIKELMDKGYVRESLSSVLCLHYLFQKKMVLGGCVLIARVSTILP